MTEPRCPFCNAQGIEKIAGRKVGPALLLYCGVCGAIHGVVPQPPARPDLVTQSGDVEKPGVTKSEMVTNELSPGKPGVTKVEPERPKRLLKETSTSEIGAMLDASRGGMYGIIFGGEENEKSPGPG